jgi:predicted trehalose synthase
MTAEQPMTIGLLQQFVESQADGWRHATDEVSRYYEDVGGTLSPSMPMPDTSSESAWPDVPPGFGTHGRLSSHARNAGPAHR